MRFSVRAWPCVSWADIRKRLPWTDEAVARFGESPDCPLEASEAARRSKGSTGPGLLALLLAADALVGKGSALEAMGKHREAIAIYDEVVTRFGASDDFVLERRAAQAMVNEGMSLGRWASPRRRSPCMTM